MKFCWIWSMDLLCIEWILLFPISPAISIHKFVRIFPRSALFPMKFIPFVHHPGARTSARVPGHPATGPDIRPLAAATPSPAPFSAKFRHTLPRCRHILPHTTSAFRKHHHRSMLPPMTILTRFGLWEFELWFPCPIVFRLYRYGSTSPSPPLISIDYSTSPRTVTSMTSLSYLAIALITHIASFCVAYPSRLAIEYCRQRDLCTLVIILHSIHTITPWCIPWNQLVCHKVVIAYTIAILVREVFHEKRAHKWKSQPSF